MRLNLNRANLEAAIYEHAKRLGKEGTHRLAKKLSVFVKKNIPTLSKYGQANATAVPHDYKAKPNEIKKSTKVVESKKYDDSYLVNVRDWRAHFMEYPTQAHDRKPRHMKVMRFLKTNGKIYSGSKTLHHPGTKGAGVFEKASDNTLIEKYIGEICTELNSGI